MKKIGQTHFLWKSILLVDERVNERRRNYNSEAHTNAKILTEIQYNLFALSGNLNFRCKISN